MSLMVLPALMIAEATPSVASLGASRFATAQMFPAWPEGEVLSFVVGTEKTAAPAARHITPAAK